MKPIATTVTVGVALLASAVGHAQLLTVPNGRDSLRLGFSNALCDDVAVMSTLRGGGASFWLATGAVAVHRKGANGSWSFSEMIEPFDGEAGDSFGWDVALTDRWLAIISLDDRVTSPHGVGSVYVYEDLGDRFEFHSRLVPPPGWNLTLFNAESIAMDGDRMVIGASSYQLHDAQYMGPNAGAIHVYDFDGTTWQHSDSATDARLGDPGGLGEDVQIDGDTIVAGNWSYSVLGFAVGLAVVFERSPSGLWEVVDRIQNPYGLGTVHFSRGMSLDGDQLAISAPGGAYGYGSVEIYERNAAHKWRHQSSLHPHGGFYASLGYSVNLHDGRLLMSAAGLPPANPFVHSGGLLYHIKCEGYWELDGRLQIPRTFNGGYFEETFAFDDDQMLISYPALSTGGFTSVGGGYVVRLPDPNSAECGELGTPIGLSSSAAPCPCGNDPLDLAQGCVNSTGQGGRLWARGQLALHAAACRFHVEGLPPGSVGVITHVGGLVNEAAPPAASGDGLLLRHSFYDPVVVHVFRADANGEVEWTPPPMLPIGIEIHIRGAFQALYRDPTGPCATGMNWTSGFIGTFVF